MYYPATFTPYADGSGHYGVTFIDFPGCVTVGQDLEDALRMAAEALSAHVGAMLAGGEKLPCPSSIAAAEEQDRREAPAERPEGLRALYQLIQFEPEMKQSETQAMRVTISLKPPVLDLIDNAARELGLTRSGFITVAAREYCSRLGL